jgi:hypothetical protein
MHIVLHRCTTNPKDSAEKLDPNIYRGGRYSNDWVRSGTSRFPDVERWASTSEGFVPAIETSFLLGKKSYSVHRAVWYSACFDGLPKPVDAETDALLEILLVKAWENKLLSNDLLEKKSKS